MLKFCIFGSNTKGNTMDNIFRNPKNILVVILKEILQEIFCKWWVDSVQCGQTKNQCRVDGFTYYIGCPWIAARGKQGVYNMKPSTLLQYNMKKQNKRILERMVRIEMLMKVSEIQSVN